MACYVSSGTSYPTHTHTHRILRLFSDCKKTHEFLRFFKMTYQQVVKSHKFSHQSVKISSYTLISDHFNSIPSCWSVIHSEPVLNAKVYRNFGLKLHFWARCLMVTYRNRLSVFVFSQNPKTWLMFFESLHTFSWTQLHTTVRYKARSVNSWTWTIQASESVPVIFFPLISYINPGNRVYCNTELAISSPETTASTYCVHTRRDGQVELASAAGYILRWHAATNGHPFLY